MAKKAHRLPQGRAVHRARKDHCASHIGAKYRGKWVAFQDASSTVVCGSGSTMLQALRAAVEAGFPHALASYVPKTSAEVRYI